MKKTLLIILAVIVGILLAFAILGVDKILQVALYSALLGGISLVFGGIIAGFSALSDKMNNREDYKRSRHAFELFKTEDGTSLEIIHTQRKWNKKMISWIVDPNLAYQKKLLSERLVILERCIESSECEGETELTIDSQDKMTIDTISERIAGLDIKEMNAVKSIFHSLGKITSPCLVRFVQIAGNYLFYWLRYNGQFHKYQMVMEKEIGACVSKDDFGKTVRIIKDKEGKLYYKLKYKEDEYSAEARTVDNIDAEPVMIHKDDIVSESKIEIKDFMMMWLLFPHVEK